MLLEGYKKEMFLPKCNPNFRSVHWVAHECGPTMPSHRSRKNHVAASLLTGVPLFPTGRSWFFSAR